jgi:ABC-2 type transport system permease protein
MLQLLKIEWLKIKNYKAFIIIASCFALGVIAANYIVFVINNNITENVQAATLLTGAYHPYSFENTWHTTSYVTGWMLMLPALLVIMLTTNEFTYRTHRQNVIDGWSRQQFTNVKLMVALVVAVATTMVVVFTALLFGLFSGTGFSLNGIGFVGFFLLKALSYNLIAVLISVLLRRTGFAIGLFFIYMGVENIISNLLDSWSVKLRNEGSIDLGAMGDYLPMGAADGLLPLPISTAKQMASNIMPTYYFGVTLAIALAYLVLFFWWSRHRMQNSDL